MKKLCFLIGNINLSGGTERVTSLIANELSKFESQISILSLSGGESSFFELEPSVRIHSLFKENTSFKKKYFLTIWKIRQFVKKYNIDTLIVVDSISCVFTVPALFGLNVKHVCWEHFNYLSNLGVRYRNIGRYLAAKYCDYVVTLTHKDKLIWSNRLGDKIKAKIIPIANPTPYEIFDEFPSLKNKIVLSVGRLTHQKGFDLLLQVWSKVCSYESDWLLRIVGSGEERDSLINQAATLGISEQVEFVPATKNIIDYYRSASIYCMSSRYEGFPMVLLEAQSFGLPVVSFDLNTGPSDIITHGKNGLLVEDGNLEKLSEALVYMMNNPNYEDYVRASKDNIRKYSLKNIVTEWQKII